MRDWKEEMPARWEREAAISAILDRGLVPRPGLAEILRSALDARVLFFGVVDCIFLSILAAALLLIPLLAAALQLLSPAPALFLASPALYALLLGLTAWKEAQSGLLDWKRSCRLSLQAVAALRMVVFGGGSVLVCVPVNLWLWRARGGELPLSWMLGVSLSSLFLYGLLARGLGGAAADVGRGVGLAGRPAGGGVPGPGRSRLGAVPAGIETVLPGAEERRRLCFQLNM